VPGTSVAATLVLFVLVYGVVFSMGLYYINRLMAKGLGGAGEEPPATGAPLRPISTAHDAGREVFAERR
jgi:cytochrome d ubiquinol oxidase subunit I